YDRRAAFGLYRDEARAFLVEPADGAKLVESLPHPDQTDSAAGRVDDHVGQPPAKLLRELEAYRLLSLDPVRLAKGRRLVPAASGTCPLHDRAGIGDRAGQEVDVRTIGGCLADDHVGGRVGHDDDNANPGARTLRGPRGAGVAGRR